MDDIIGKKLQIFLNVKASFAEIEILNLKPDYFNLLRNTMSFEILKIWLKL